MTFAARPSWARRCVPNALVRRYSPGESGVVLTFDDGPHAEHTHAVLDRLAAFDAKAVFFVVGRRIASSPETLRRIVSEGHALGNHTFHHPVPSWFAGRSAGRDVEACQRLVTQTAGHVPTWFRPPLGRLTPGLLFAAWQRGLPVMNWSLDSGDWRCRSDDDAEQCAAETLKLARPGDVILFHDDHPHIGRILDLVLPELLAR